MKVRSRFGWAWGALVVALVLAGCDGSDGAPGPQGPQGPQGETGGILSAPYHRSDLDLSGESCAVCHGSGALVDVEAVHGDPPEAVIPSVLPVVDMSADPQLLENVEVVSQITDVTIPAPNGTRQPEVTFTLRTAVNDIPIVGLENVWGANINPPDPGDDSRRVVRFTITQLQPGTNGDPNGWVAYTRDTVNDGTTDPDYDIGVSLVPVDVVNQPGTYVFTFNTDIDQLTGGLTYDETLTHRVAGQIGGGVTLQPQNMVFDFRPDGNAITTTHNVAVMDSCNECHDDLVFHGRRFMVEYCVQCHNSGLEGGEGNMSYMVHRIHAAGTFANLDGGASFADVTYPQDLKNCRKCHSAGVMVGVTTTPDGDNWMNVPNMASCDGCHGVFEAADFNTYHTGGTQNDNTGCAICHDPGDIEGYHVTANATVHNPLLENNQREITYELMSADIVAGDLVVEFRISSDGTPLDIRSLPQDLLDGDRYPGLLLAWAQPQDGIATPADFNNLGRRGGQPISIGLDDLAPIDAASTIGNLTWDGTAQTNTATITDAASRFPIGAMMRTVGLQGYLRQDLDGDGTYDVSLHTPSKMMTVNGDDARRVIVDNNKCANCHEFFEGHGGNRVFTYGSTELLICTMCHGVNTSSSGRTIGTPSQDLLDDFADHGPIPGVDPNNPLTYPEDSQNLKDMVHGIHSSAFRTREFQHVRGGREGYYNWSEVTLPRGAETSNCLLCHLDGTYELPLGADLLPTTVRTTSVEDGDDPDTASVEGAFQSVPNPTDWVNTPMAAACGSCHTWYQAVSHMQQMGGFLNDSPFAD